MFERLRERLEGVKIPLPARKVRFSRSRRDFLGFSLFAAVEAALVACGKDSKDKPEDFFKGFKTQWIEENGQRLVLRPLLSFSSVNEELVLEVKQREVNGVPRRVLELEEVLPPGFETFRLIQEANGLPLEWRDNNISGGKVVIKARKDGDGYMIGWREDYFSAEEVENLPPPTQTPKST